MMSEQVSSRPAVARLRRALAWIAATAVVGILGVVGLAAQDEAVRNDHVEIALPSWARTEHAAPTAATAVPLIDHSVVRSLSLADQPDITGVSIAEYGR
jgi:plasmid replication initiation protein